MAESEVTPGKLLLLEYERLKDEQRGRIGFRDGLVYATLASMAAAVAAVLQAKGDPGLLLLLPAVAVVLGWAFLVNDQKVSAIGRYIRTDLIPRLAAMVPDGTVVFGWELAHRTDNRRRSRKALQLVVDLMLFCGAPAAALVVAWTLGGLHTALVVVSIVEAVAVVVLAVQIVVYADLSS